MQRLIEELFDSYYPDVYRYLYSLSRDASLSEDLAQETFLDAIRYISSFRGEANVKTWLFAIARNRWYTHLRKKNRQVNTTSLSILLDSGTIPPEDQYQLKEISERIRQQYQKLTRAKANAIRSGQPTPRLDAKIERIRLLMNCTVKRVPDPRPSESKYRNYKGVGKQPMQGGSVTPK